MFSAAAFLPIRAAITRAVEVVPRAGIEFAASPAFAMHACEIAAPEIIMSEIATSIKPSMRVCVKSVTGETPVGDGGAVRIIVGMIEQEGVTQPVEAPCQPSPGRVREGRHGDAEPEAKWRRSSER